MACLFGVQFAVKAIQIIQVYRNRFFAVKILIASLLLLFWLHLRKKPQKTTKQTNTQKYPPTPTIQVTDSFLIQVYFSYISHDVKISLVNSSQEAVWLEIHLLHEGLFFPSVRILNICCASLLGSGGKGRPVTVILSLVTRVSLIFHLRGNSGDQTFVSCF